MKRTNFEDKRKLAVWQIPKLEAARIDSERLGRPETRIFSDAVYNKNQKNMRISLFVFVSTPV